MKTGTERHWQMDGSAVAVLATVGGLLVSLCLCACVCGRGGKRSPKEKKSEQVASSRIGRCFRLTTYVPFFAIFRKASSVLDPCGLSSRRYANPVTHTLVSTTSSVRSYRVFEYLAQIFGEKAAANPSGTRLKTDNLLHSP